MPSNARQKFKRRLLPDVTRLLQTHEELNPPGRGRRHLGHITRSGVLSLCAAWELYIEDVVCEGAQHLANRSGVPDSLPDHVKGKIAQVAKNNKHNFGVLELCGEGWKSVYLGAVKRECEQLNTPKFGNIAKIFEDWLGLTAAEISATWRHPVEDLNSFVRLRGEIAHRGADAQYVQRNQLRDFVQTLDEIVVDTDNALWRHLKAISNGGRAPWNIIPIRQ